MSFLIYLIHPAEQQTKPGRSLLHVHNPRHLWHLGHAGCRHLCKGSRFIFDEFVKIPLLWLRFCFFDIKTSGGRHFAWVQLQQAPWNYLWWWLLAWGSGLWILFVLQQWLFSLKALAVVCLIAWSLVSTYVLLRSIDFFLPFRAGAFFFYNSCLQTHGKCVFVQLYWKSDGSLTNNFGIYFYIELRNPFFVVLSPKISLSIILPLI